MRARSTVVFGLLLLLSACATDRSALQPVGVSTRTDAEIARLGLRTPQSVPSAPASSAARSTSRSSVVAPSRRAVSVPARTMTAKTLAGHMALTYVDQSDHVFLSDDATHVRIWKDSGKVMVAGRERTLTARTHRQGRSLIVPAPMVQYVATEVGAQRKKLDNAVHRRLPVLVSTGEPTGPKTVAPPKTAPRTKPTSIFDMPLAQPGPYAEPRPSVPGDPAWSHHVASQRAWRWIVVHHSDDTSGNFAKYDRLHREDKGWDECGYHFVIGNGSLSGDGQVEPGTRWFKQKHGAHCKTCDNRYNDYGIGICLVGDFEAGGRPTARQMDSLVQLCRWLVATYGIREDMILGHCDACATACPGKHFPWAELRRRVAAR